jgi:hypothetical protein
MEEPTGNDEWKRRMEETPFPFGFSIRFFQSVFPLVFVA